MVKEFSGKGFKAPRGSLRSLRVSPPVFTMVVVTFKFFNPSTLVFEVRVLTVTLGMPERAGAAETAIAEATRAMREARMEEENMVVKVVKGLKRRFRRSLRTERAWLK